MIRGFANLLGQLALVAKSGLYSDLVGCPSVPTMIQRTRAQTNTNGSLTWTFPQAYGAGVIPIIQISVEDSGTGAFDHKIISISNTSVTIQIVKTSVVSILGIDVLGIQANPQAWIHVSAMTP